MPTPTSGESPSATAEPDTAAALAADLSALWRARLADADTLSWQTAERYVTGFHAIALGRWGHVPGGREENRYSREVNREVRQQEGYEGPGGSWLSHALRLKQTWPDLFGAGTKQGTYADYRLIVTSSLVGKVKHELRRWLERKPRTRAEVRARVRREVDQQAGVTRPDFDLKVTNCWRFSDKTRAGDFDGGIHPDLVANLLHYFTDPGDVVLDPMAGGDTTRMVLDRYQFFRHQGEALPGSGPRSLVRLDVAPRARGVIAHDARRPLPLAAASVDFVLLDPPYYKTALGKYESWSVDADVWSGSLRQVISNCLPVLKSGGRLAVVLDDYLRAREFVPLAALGYSVCMGLGLAPVATIYNTYPHCVVSMSPVEMSRAKAARLMVNQTKVINVFQKP